MNRMLTAVMALTLLAAPTWAASVNCTSGGLEDAVTDLSITELTVSGTIDVRDFSFIAESLEALTTLDISATTITEYTCGASESYFAERGTFAAGTLPLTSFFGMGLTQVSLPSSLEAIGAGAFAGCTSLTAISIPASVTEIGEGAFYGSGLVSVSVDAATIGDRAFTYCQSLLAVEIGASVQTIGEAAFAGCPSLAAVTLASSSSLAEIGDEAFAETAIKTFNFYNCSSDVKLGEWIFAGAPISSPILPTGLTEIPEGTYFGNTGATEITIPDAVVTIGNYAYYGNSALTTMTVPSQVTYIGDNAFEGTGLTEVTAWPTTAPELGEDVFEGVNDSSRAKLIVVEDAYTSYSTAEQWKEFDIQVDDSGVDDIVAEDATLKALFIDKTLEIIATECIVRLTVADETGMTISYNDTHSCTVDVDTSALGGHVYVVRAWLANGTSRTLKLMRR